MKHLRGVRLDIMGGGRSTRGTSWFLFSQAPKTFFPLALILDTGSRNLVAFIDRDRVGVFIFRCAVLWKDSFVPLVCDPLLFVRIGTRGFPLAGLLRTYGVQSPVNVTDKCCSLGLNAPATSRIGGGTAARIERSRMQTT